MLRTLAQAVARLIGAPLPEYPDGTPMPPEEYEEMMYELDEEKLHLDDELYRMTEWEEEDRRDGEW